MRAIVNINENWVFCKTQGLPTVFPADWENVNLPHTWNAVDGQDGGGDYFRGHGMYAKTITRDQIPASEKYYLEINGANSSADVYWNGGHLFHHDGGYSIWRVELPDIREENLLVVDVDNSPNETVYPQVADFTFYGGLYRNVNLVCVPDSHFDLMTYGTPGIKVTPDVEGKSVEVEVSVENPSAGQSLHYCVKNAEGAVVAETETPLTVSSGGDNAGATDEALSTVKSVVLSAHRCVTLQLNDIHLWHGRKDPYLYTVEVELLEQAGRPAVDSSAEADAAPGRSAVDSSAEADAAPDHPEAGSNVLDSVHARVGFRTFHVDPDKGFFLNGEEYPLRGVSRHQDRWGIGNALLPEHHEEDMDLICELGANTIRLAHYQHDQYFYDLCDEKGMVVWAEIPYISRHMPGGWENTISQMTELITQNYNHASIVCWGLSNEITMSGAATEEVKENHRVLNDLCHRLDKTRFTTMACMTTTSIKDPYLSIPDVISYNHYFGWYGGETDMNGSWMDDFHKTNPTIAIGMSEYGCEGLNWHNSNPQAGDYTEEYQAYYHEELIKQLFPRKYIWATHVWNMFDFGCDNRNEGGENGQNHKGLVTIDRKYKKDAFYAYKAWLSDEPFVHICGKRYVDRVEDVTKVTVYSNQPSVELFANGISLGIQTCPEHFFYYRVPNAGVTRLEAVAGVACEGKAEADNCPGGVSSEGKVRVKATTEACLDHSEIHKVEEFNENYRLKEAGAILNWCDVTMPEGYFSINDKIGDITSTFPGKIVFGSFLLKLIRQMKDKGGKKTRATDESGAGEKSNTQGGATADMLKDKNILKMASGFTILRVASMSGVIGITITKEMLLDMNRKLNKIKKK